MPAALSSPLVRIALLAALIGAAVARADDTKPRARLVLEEEQVPGRVHRPEVTIFVTRQNLREDVQIELRESFIPRIVESADHGPI